MTTATEPLVERAIKAGAPLHHNQADNDNKSFLACVVSHMSNAEFLEYIQIPRFREWLIELAEILDNSDAEESYA